MLNQVYDKSNIAAAVTLKLSIVSHYYRMSWHELLLLLLVSIL